MERMISGDKVKVRPFSEKMPTNDSQKPAKLPFSVLLLLLL
jgi:hypothetical protein